jgi:RNA polymerase sigma-70 factor (ECF subfamily)
MNAQPEPSNQVLEQLRAYLECLTAIQVDPRLRIDPRARARFGWSDIINATLLKVNQDMNRLRGMDSQAQARWLRTMLAHNLIDRIRRELSPGRDFRLEQPLEDAVAASSCRLGDWVPAEESSPSQKLMKQEQSLQLAHALGQLPEREREAIILQKWHGWKLAQIAEHLGCTTGAVAGLQARGLARLRRLLPADLME